MQFTIVRTPGVAILVCAFSLGAFSLGAFSLGAFSLGQSSLAADKKAAVELKLNKVAARYSDNHTLFRCEATLVNNTKKAIAISSNFSSVFDITDIVVKKKGGKLLKQQAYIYHQSPFTSKGRKFFLKPGETTANLAFPIADFGEPGQVVKVQLVGVLSAEQLESGQRNEAGTVSLESNLEQIAIER